MKLEVDVKPGDLLVVDADTAGTASSILKVARTGLRFGNIMTHHPTKENIEYQIIKDWIIGYIPSGILEEER